MELSEILNFLKSKIKELSLLFILGAVIGGTIYFLMPTKYISAGTFYIARSPEESNEFYTYSGYYAQQVALSYTKTIRGLLEDNVLYSKALEELDIPLNERNLRKIRNKIQVKDAGPQLVTLEVKDKSPEMAVQTWEALAANVTSTSIQINKRGDPNLSINRIKEEPVTKEAYKNLYVFSLMGALLFFGAGTFMLALNNYLKNQSND